MDRDKIRKSVHMLLEGLGIDIEKEHFRKNT